ncbi:MAG: GNAT family N-acetyltransferase [Chthonomonas sp.]|nr:GNAT family N-acetyltransferase [Chthonomonas sp.]
MLRTELLTGVAALEGLAEPWADLLRHSPSGTVFQTPAWLLTVARLRRRSLRTIALYEGRDLVALYPLERRRQPWLSVRPLGTGPSDYLGPLILENRADIAAAMWDALTQLPADVLDLHQIRENHPLLAAAPSSETTDQAECLVLDLPDTWDAYAKSLNKSLRYEVRRPEKEPYLTQGARLETATEPEAMRRAFDIFLELHAQRWRKRGLPGAFALPHLKRLHYEWLQRAEGHAHFHLLWMNDQPAGVLYGMRVPGRTYFYQSGFDPAYNQLSPGTVLVASAIRAAIERGDAEFDFLRGAEAYKRRWQPQRSLRNVRLMVKGSPAAGTVGLWAKNMGWKVEQQIRKRLEGKGLH